MLTKRNSLLSGILFLLLFVSACGAAPAATEAPSLPPAPTYEFIPEEHAPTEAPGPS